MMPPVKDGLEVCAADIGHAIDQVLKAFGSPGDWGYGTEKGEALYALHKARFEQQTSADPVPSRAVPVTGDDLVNRLIHDSCDTDCCTQRQEAAAHIEALQAKLATAETALRPFLAVFDGYGEPQYGDDCVVYSLYKQSTGETLYLRSRDVRAARALVPSHAGSSPGEVRS
jgi:hypothetical protein